MLSPGGEGAAMVEVWGGKEGVVVWCGVVWAPVLSFVLEQFGQNISVSVSSIEMPLTEAASVLTPHGEPLLRRTQAASSRSFNSVSINAPPPPLLLFEQSSPGHASKLSHRI